MIGNFALPAARGEEHLELELQSLKAMNRSPTTRRQGCGGGGGGGEFACKEASFDMWGVEAIPIWQPLLTSRCCSSQ